MTKKRYDFKDWRDQEHWVACETRQDAVELAYGMFIDECVQDGVSADQREVVIIEYAWNKQKQEWVPVGEYEHDLYYTAAPDDLDEHGTWHKGGGGVL